MASGGCVRSAARSAASTRPCASATATSSAGSAATLSSTRASASATGSKATSCLRGVPITGLAAALFDQADALDAHAALDRFDHVVDRQTRDGGRGERLHLVSGPAGDADGCAHDDAREVGLRHQFDVDFGDVERGTERDKLRGAL